MMVYEKFQELLTSLLQEKLDGSCRLRIQKIPRNNGIMLNGLTVTAGGQTAAPLICLEQYYEKFRAGRPLDALADEILNELRKDSDILHIDFSMLNDFEKIRDRIIFRLISTHANQTLLQDVPSVPFQDLSAVFYLFLENGPSGQMTALISRRHQRMWDVTTQTLYDLAEQNTPLLLPPELKSMAAVMNDIAREHMGKHYREGIVDELLPGHRDVPLFVLSNTSGLHGACAVLYPGVLKNFADQLEKDLVVLPSSIHEVLLLPYDDSMVFSEMSDMVADINQAAVAAEDRLSDQVYYYSRSDGEMIIAADTASAFVS